MAEVAAASDEQAKGIGQVNTAIADIDSVTQSNAAAAEQSAAASEELTAQANDLTSLVSELENVVHGAKVRKNGTAYLHRVFSFFPKASLMTPAPCTGSRNLPCGPWMRMRQNAYCPWVITTTTTVITVNSKPLGCELMNAIKKVPN